MTVCTPSAPSADPPKKETQTIEQQLKKHKPAIAGIITSVDAERIRVEENPHKFRGGNKGVLGLGKTTEYWIRDGKTFKRGKKEDLYPGMKVEVWTPNGLILPSYPFQAGAKYIVYDEKERKVFKEIYNTKPSFVGKISKIDKGLFVDVLEDGNRAASYLIFLKKESLIYHHVYGELYPGKVEDLKVGMEVKIWASAIRESYPIQVDVKYLVY